MTTIDTPRSRVALTVAHCAGMLDAVALPVWVGVLISRYGFDSQQAGLMVTLFLAGVVAASLLLAPRFGHLSGRVVASAGFAVCAVGFWAATQSTTFAMLALLHAICGVANGAALSITHGTIALSARPHRMYALVNTALGIAGTLYLGITPQIVARFGGPVLFAVFGAVMVVAALVCTWGFPTAGRQAVVAAVGGRHEPISRPVWFGIGGIILLAVVQAMVFSFVERVGADRGYGAAAVAGVLIALGLVNLVPAPLAALLERRLQARSVLVLAPVVQALLALVVTNAAPYWAYAASASLFVAVVIFAHTFAFGLLARLEPSGRVLSATPATLMAGAAIGPALGGTLVKAFGYGSLGLAAIALCCGGVACFLQLPRDRANAQAPHAAGARA